MIRALIAVCLTWLLPAPAHAQDGKFLPKAVVDSVLSKYECESTVDQAIEDAQVFNLGFDMKMAVLPCWMAAYNSGNLILTVDPRRPDEANAEAFRAFAGAETYSEMQKEPNAKDRWRTVRVLWNVEYDKSAMRLTSLNRFRQIGDCGSSGHYDWSGREFRLVGYWYKKECDGTPFLPGGTKWKIAP